MVSDRNRQIIERRRSGESSAISAPRWEFRANGRARSSSARNVANSAPESLRKPPASPRSQIRIICRRGCVTCWPRCSESPTLRPTTSQLLNTQLRCSGRSQILDCGIGKSLRRGWSVHESRLRINAAAAVRIPTILDKEEHSAAYRARSFLPSHIYAIATRSPHASSTTLFFDLLPPFDPSRSRRGAEQHRRGRRDSDRRIPADGSQTASGRGGRL